jgi:hypothetical protein
LNATPLPKLLALWQQQGFQFIYSSNLVNDRVEVNHPDKLGSFASLRSALKSVGLALVDSGDGLWLIVAAEPEPTVQISGRLRDANSLSPIAGVIVQMGDAKVASDGQGEFTLEGEFNSPIRLHHPLYEQQTIASISNDEFLDVRLQKAVMLEEIVVNASQYILNQSKASSVQQLTHEQLDYLPRFGDDSFRAVLAIPGSASVGVSAAPHIRGGFQDESLILFNGIELLDPFHLKDFQSLFSALDPAIIDSIDVYTGGFPARYGNRMSGVLDIAPANTESPIEAALNISLLQSAASFSIEPDEDSQLNIAVRRGNLDLVLDQVNPSLGDPRYYDFYSQYSSELSEATKFEMGLLGFVDDLNISDGDENDSSHTRANYRNFYAWLGWQQSTNLYSSKTMLSVADIYQKRRGTVNDPDAAGSMGYVQDHRQFKRYSLNQTFEFEPRDAVELELGAILHYQTGRYRHIADFTRGALAESFGLGRLVQRDIAVDPEGLHGAVHTAITNQWTDNLATEFGLRWDFQRYSNDTFESQFSPRLALRYDWSADTELKFAVGRFYQAQGIHELAVESGETQFQSAQYSDHAIIGLVHDINSDWMVRAEIFNKRIRNPKRRHENLYNPLVLIPEAAVDWVEVAPEKARSRGVEVSLNYRPSSTLSSWLSYTRSTVEDRIDNEWQRRRWDQAHTVQAGFISFIGNWSLSSNVTWHSGWQTTKLPSHISSYSDLAYSRNDNELSDYFAVNARVAYEWLYPQQSMTVYLDISNLSNRKNIGALDYETEPSGSGFDLKVEREELLEIVPSIGFEWNFYR